MNVLPNFVDTLSLATDMCIPGSSLCGSVGIDGMEIRLVGGGGDYYWKFRRNFAFFNE